MKCKNRRLTTSQRVARLLDERSLGGDVGEPWPRDGKQAVSAYGYEEGDLLLCIPGGWATASVLIPVDSWLEVGAPHVDTSP